MAKSIPAVVLAALFLPSIGLAKDKTTLPAYVLQAHTVAVIIHPDAGIDLEQPDANKIAQRDLEAALLNWGRLIRQFHDRTRTSSSLFVKATADRTGHYYRSATKQ